MSEAQMRHCEELHDLTHEFAFAMRHKLTKKCEEGRSGGLDPENRAWVFKLLKEHVSKAESALAAGQEVDIANLAMMLWGSRRTMEERIPEAGK